MANNKQNEQTQTQNQNTQDNQDTSEQKGVVIDYDAQWIADIDKVLHSDLPIDEKRKEIAKIVNDEIVEVVKSHTMYNCVVTVSATFKATHPKSKAWSPAYLPSMCQITHIQTILTVTNDQLDQLQLDEFVTIIECVAV